MSNNNNNSRRRLYEAIIDDEDDAVYDRVVRHTRRRTTYEYRGTALTPAQVIDRDTYYAYASIAFMQGMRLYHLVLLHLVMYRRLQQCITVVTGSVTPHVIAAMQEKMESLKSIALGLVMIIRFTLAYCEICYLQVEDLVFVIRRRHRFREPMHRFLDEHFIQVISVAMDTNFKSSSFPSASLVLSLLQKFDRMIMVYRI